VNHHENSVPARTAAEELPSPPGGSMTPGGGAVLYGERRNGPASAIATLLGRASSSVGGEELRRHDRNRYDGDVAHTRANLVPGVRDAGCHVLLSVATSEP
jgi:hypothetical protein